MLMTDEELHQLREDLESRGAYDDELLMRCASLVHVGAFDEAIRSAFVLLEERLRAAVDREDMTGTKLANYAFSESGPLGKLITQSPSEREGLREIFSGSFKLFRNPTADGVVEYSAAEGQAILGLVDLMLGILKRAGEAPPQGLLPANVEGRLAKAEGSIGAGGAQRLGVFLAKCVQMGLVPSSSPKFWIPFKRYAFVKYGHWDEPKRYRIPVFYVDSKTLQVPLSNYYGIVVDIDFRESVQKLKDLGFRPQGKNREPTINLATHNSAAFFEALLDIVEEISELFEESLLQV